MLIKMTEMALATAAAPVAALVAASAKRRKITMAFAPGDITDPIAEAAAAAGRAGALVAQ
jgi:hypothetical protein